MWFYQILTILVVSSLPFFGKQFVYYDNPPEIVTIVQLFGIVLIPVFIKSLFSDIKLRFIPTFFFVVFLIPLAVSTIYSLNKTHSSTMLLLFVSYFVIFVSIRSIFSTFKSKVLLTSYFLLLTSVLSVISLYNTLILHEVNRDHVNFFEIFYGHNHLSALLVFAVPSSLYFLKTYWQKKQIRILLLVNCFLLLVSLLFTFSIGAMFSLTIAFLITLVLFGKTHFSFNKIYFIVFLIIAVFGISSFYIFSETKGIKIKFISPQTQTTKKIKLYKDPVAYAQTRFIYWQLAYENFLRKPLTGSGLDTFGFVEFDSQIKSFSSNAHNFFIQTLSDTGMFGFIASIVLVGSVLIKGFDTIKKNLSKEKRLFYISLFIGVLSSVLFAAIDFDWYLPTVSVFFWLFAGILSERSESKDYAN